MYEINVRRKNRTPKKKRELDAAKNGEKQRNNNEKKRTNLYRT